MKLKYKFKVHHLLESYPTEEDALFEILNFLRDRNKLEEEWSDLGIKGAFSTKLSEEEIKKLLDSLVKQEFISMKAGSGKRNYFKIIKIPKTIE
jgi:hypothetical protein